MFVPSPNSYSIHKLIYISFLPISKRYIIEELSLIKELKKIYFIKDFFLYQQSQICQSYQGFFVIVLVDVVFFRNSPK